MKLFLTCLAASLPLLAGTAALASEEAPTEAAAPVAEETETPAEAVAQTEAAESTDAGKESAAGKIHLAPQEPTREQRTYHRHDGFYLRANFGLGLLWANINDASPADFDVDASGTVMALDLLIGGTPSPGLALGGGFIGNFAFSASFERQGVDVPDRDVQSGTLGVFVDGFPSVTGPWHLGLLIGAAGVNINQDNFVSNTFGLGGAAWAGYTQWVADDWALGGLLRFTMNRTGGEDNGFDVTASTATLSLMFSALYH